MGLMLVPSTAITITVSVPEGEKAISSTITVSVPEGEIAISPLVLPHPTAMTMPARVKLTVGEIISPY
jgi:hypothetical protein